MNLYEAKRIIVFFHSVRSLAVLARERAESVSAVVLECLSVRRTSYPFWSRAAVRRLVLSQTSPVACLRLLVSRLAGQRSLSWPIRTFFGLRD